MPGDRVVGAEPERAGVDQHEVRLHLLEVDRHAGLDKALGQAAGVRVVIRKPLDVVVERVEPGGRDDPGLAHRAAEEVLEAPRLRHPLPRPGDERAERAAEALGEAEAHGVELAPVLGRRDAGGDRGVEEPGAVQVRREPVNPGLRGHLPHLRERPDAPAAAVVRVLDADELRRRHVQVGGRVDHLAELLGV